MSIPLAVNKCPGNAFEHGKYVPGFQECASPKTHTILGLTMERGCDARHPALISNFMINSQL
jgi:hypothetical protein